MKGIHSVKLWAFTVLYWRHTKFKTPCSPTSTFATYTLQVPKIPIATLHLIIFNNILLKITFVSHSEKKDKEINKSANNKSNNKSTDKKDEEIRKSKGAKLTAVPVAPRPSPQVIASLIINYLPLETKQYIFIVDMRN